MQARWTVTTTSPSVACINGLPVISAFLQCSQ
jgi:hypothetical protein